ncbi:putative ribonuclease H-like domain-containing protein [Tanacetum coccineum]
MTGNMSYLSDFKEFDEGYVTFGGGAKGRRITSKGTLKTGKLDFEDVYFVKELQFNLFSVSQMCDKKNSVLFTNTGCFILSPDFKLADESQVLLKVPRKNNMYSVDMKNIIPKASLTCLVAKATLYESVLWHRRLGHVNFKTINKLVKGNLVKGLPIKHFENDQTFVACLKGKQHKDSSRIPQQNGVAERRNMTLIEAARTMLADSMLPTTFWVKVVNTACYVKNMILVVKPHNKTPYELFRDGSPFDSSSKDACNDEPQPSNDARKKNDEGGINDQERTKNSAQDVNIARPSINTVSTNFNTGSLNINTVSPTVPTALLESTYTDFFSDESELELSNIATTYPVPTTPNTRIHKDHSLDHVLGDVQSSVQTRRMINEQGFISVVYEGKTHEDLHTCLFACFLSQEEPKKVIQALKYPSWIEAIQEELLNKKDESVAMIEAIRLFLAYASFKDFVVYQMDVKSAFLYGKIAHLKVDAAYRSSLIRHIGLYIFVVACEVQVQIRRTFLDGYDVLDFRTTVS